VEPAGFTAVYILSLTEGGGHDFTYYRAGAAASRYSPRDLNTEYIAKAKVLHGSGISLAVSGSLREASLEAMRACREAGGMVSFDVNMRPKLWPLDVAKTACGRAVGNSDVVFASVEDTQTLYGVGEPERAAEKLRSLGAGTAVIKRGGEGCYVSSEGASFDSPGYSVDVIDTTGSGDAFDAAFMLGLLEKWSMEKSAAFANAVGALTATGLGAVAPIPTRAQALGLIASRRRS
jgi:2-dehydro-3-deoxygluconokinase